MDGLIWVSDRDPGIHRLRKGEGFAYRDAAGKWVRNADVLQRIRKLAIPPAYCDVWICPSPEGHLQATGRDARGRKQYRYHALWQAQRGETKFGQLQAFGKALPGIRRAVGTALAPADQATRPAVLAALVRLLDTTWMRIGNAEYARDNASYGLSTLHGRHVGVKGDALRLSFTGKGGVRHVVELTDRRVAAVVRRCRELPGQQLFQYVDAAGGTHRVESADVNAWLAEAAGRRVTAKDYRTWHASVLALDLLLEACRSPGDSFSLPAVVAQVAKRLGNTPAVCRKAYIHPTVLALGETLHDAAARTALLAQPWVHRRSTQRGLSGAEVRLMALLRRRVRR